MKYFFKIGIFMIVLLVGALIVIGVYPEEKEIREGLQPADGEKNLREIVFDSGVADYLNSMLDNKFELSACLIGESWNNGYYITKAIENPISSNGPDFVKIAKQCDEKNVLGNVHTHPNGDCRLSLADAYAFGDTENKITGVVCGVNDFAIYEPEKLYSRMTTTTEEI